MTDPQQNARLNEVLIDVGRSLLQYTREAWPWSGDGDSATQDRLNGLIARQQPVLAQLAELLDDRHWPIDFGTYPDYSRFHFVAIDYLLAELVQEARRHEDEIQAALRDAEGDADAAHVLRQLLAEQQGIVAELGEIVASSEPSATA